MKCKVSPAWALSKKAQEEIIGFAIIIVIVAVIALIFLGISLNKPQEDFVESYEAESFLQVMLSYTSDCSSSRTDNMQIRELIGSCADNNVCVDGRQSCEVLEQTIKGILDKTWPVGENRPNAGYKMTIIEDNEEILKIEKGNKTSSYKGSSGLEGFDIEFVVYSQTRA